MNLYDRLLRLQKIEHGYEQWAAYRQQLTQYIVAHSPQRKCIGIVGAGRCQDVDLGILAQHFDKIILIDKDESAMRVAMDAYPMEDSNVVQCYVCDLIGIDPEDYRAYADALVMKVRERGVATSCQELAEFAMGELEKLYYKAVSAQVVLPVCDTLVVVGLHSQLLSMLEWIWSLILQTIGQEEQYVRLYISQMNDRLVKKVNAHLLAAAKYRLIMGCEQGRQGRVGAVQGALQSLEDMKLRMVLGEVKMSDETVLVWPFDRQQGIVYDMLIQTMQKGEDSR